MTRARIAAVFGRRDFIAGLVVIAIAAGIVGGSLDLPIGTPVRMGAGFLPLGIGLVLFAVGIAILVSGLQEGEPVPPFRTLRPVTALAASFAVFAVAIEPLGAAIAVTATVVVASAATPVRHVLETLIYAVALAAFTVLLFVEFLGVPMTVWP